ncbi:MAG TPA: hypothetical protein VGZ29_00265 [Terriglobia bacterium]|nr:hypothetical protein [Terriglobia bacterium]
MPAEIHPPATPRESTRTRARRLALGALFSAILLIPRLRRLRRRPRAWLAFRAGAGLAGAVLIWRFARADAGSGSLAAGVALIALAALVRSRPQKKTADEVARELGALVAVNGGEFAAAAGNGSRRPVYIFVHPERLLVLTPAFRRLVEIPLAGLRQVSTGPAGANGRRRDEAWELRIDWESEGRQAAVFHYQGTFAEHLARVAGQTITTVWKKSLPVLPI